MLRCATKGSARLQRLVALRSQHIDFLETRVPHVRLTCRFLSCQRSARCTESGHDRSRRARRAASTSSHSPSTRPNTLVATQHHSMQLLGLPGVAPPPCQDGHPLPRTLCRIFLQQDSAGLNLSPGCTNLKSSHTLFIQKSNRHRDRQSRIRSTLIEVYRDLVKPIEKKPGSRRPGLMRRGVIGEG